LTLVTRAFDKPILRRFCEKAALKPLKRVPPIWKTEARAGMAEVQVMGAFWHSSQPSEI